MMLQVNMKPYASDALEDAMRLAQTKALNSYTFSDCLNYLNYAWRDIYDRMAMIDDGYYGVNVLLKKRMTKIPPFVKNTVLVYAAQSPRGFDRLAYRSSGTTDMSSPGTYHISGTDLWCPDAERRRVWLYYVPACPQIFFTHHNRDPVLHDEAPAAERSSIYNAFILKAYNSDGEEVEYDTSGADAADREGMKEITRWALLRRGAPSADEGEDITENLMPDDSDDDDDGKWLPVYAHCDYPYIFMAFEHSVTGEHLSGFFGRDLHFNVYNPFDFTGRNSDVEYVRAKWNDKTGMGVVVLDYNDLNPDGTPKCKELGWTPDTLLDYPVPEMYRYLVARLADKFSALNESEVMGVQKELVEAKFAFEAYLEKDKSAWKRIVNVNPATISDWL